MISRGELKTEQQNHKSLQIDSSSIVEILSTINEEDKGVADAVEKAIPEIEKVVSFCVNSIKNGGRVFYIGAGTSGRLGVLVASEVPPTYSAQKGLVIGVIEGCENALRNYIDGEEVKQEED